MLNFFTRTIDDILPFNPLVLFKKDQRTKLSKMFDRGVSNVTDDTAKAVRQYFEGKQYGSKAALGADPRARKTRRIAGGIAGGLMAANYLDVNPFGATDLATNVASLGAHGILGGSMIRGAGGLSKGLGIGYLGLAGLNTMRPGDNRGPM